MATWGQQTWGYENWGTLGDQTVVLSSLNLSASFSIGTVVVDNEIQVGWGGDTWGENTWGDLSGAFGNPTGVQANFTIGTITTSANADIDVTGVSLTITNAGATGGSSIDLTATGQELQLFIGEEVINIGVPVTGSQATTSAGQLTVDDEFLIGAGWGRDTFGNLGWGVNYSAAPSMAQLTSSIGEETSFTDVVVNLTSLDLNITYANPSFSIQIDSDVFVLASEDQLDALIGTITTSANADIDVTGIELTGEVGQAVGGTKTPVDVTGIQATLTLGDFTLVQSTVESITGFELTSSIGEAEEIPAQMIGVTGLELTSSIGSVTVIGQGNIDVTGIELTLNVGSLNITPWQEIDPGVNNTWTSVDLAA